MRRDSEVGVAGRAQWQVQLQPLNVQHDGNATDQPVLVGGTGRRHRLADVVDRGETTVHRSRQARQNDGRGHRVPGSERWRIASRSRSAASRRSSPPRSRRSHHCRTGSVSGTSSTTAGHGGAGASKVASDVQRVMMLASARPSAGTRCRLSAICQQFVRELVETSGYQTTPNDTAAIRKRPLNRHDGQPRTTTDTPISGVQVPLRPPCDVARRHRLSKPTDVVVGSDVQAACSGSGCS